MRTFRIACVLLLLMVCSNQILAGPFDKGAMRVNLILSRATAFGENYNVYGLGFGYYVLDGLELGVSYEAWRGGSLDIDQLSPELRYVFQNKSVVDPYLGTFYRRTFIEQLDDVDAYGFRYGLFFNTNSRVFFGIGGVYIKYRDCDSGLAASCSDSYPEFSLAFGF